MHNGIYVESRTEYKLDLFYIDSIFGSIIYSIYVLPPTCELKWFPFSMLNNCWVVKTYLVDDRTWCFIINNHMLQLSQQTALVAIKISVWRKHGCGLPSSIWSLWYLFQVCFQAAWAPLQSESSKLHPLSAWKVEVVD